MDVVGLLNRLFARFGFRLLLIEDLEDERRANALAIEALEQRLQGLTERHDALTQRHADLTASHSSLTGRHAALEDVHSELVRARADDQARFWGKLHGVRLTLDHSRAAEAGAHDMLARQAAAFAERTEAEAQARRSGELELWGRISDLRSTVEAGRRARSTADQLAREASEAQAQAHERARNDLWARLEAEQSRLAAAREAEAETRRALDQTQQELERIRGQNQWLSRRLERETARRAHAEAVAAGKGDGISAMRAARAFRDQGRLDLAATTLSQGGDYLLSPKIDAFYLQLLCDMDDNRGLQQALRASIERLPESAASAHAAYLAMLCRQAGLACLEPASVELLLNKIQRAAIKSRPLRAFRDALRRRLEFGRSVRESLEGHASLISLGLNCMPWTLANRWGLRDAEEFSSLFTPFAYGVHKMKSVVRALQSDFEDYVPAEKLKAVETKGGHLTPMRTDGLAFWNHNLGPYWVDDGFARFREGMAVKIEGFRAACRAEDAVFMISKAPIDYPAQPLSLVEDLNQALERFTGRANNRLLFWNEYAETAGRHVVDPWTHVLNCPYPSADYVWYDTADSAEALAYESGCAQAIVDSLRDWGLLRPRGGTAEAVAEAALAVG